MHTTLDWTNSINWLIAAALLFLLIGQVWLIIRNRSLSTGRKGLRIGLNGLLWLLIVGYFLQFRWKTDRSVTHALLVAEDIPAAFVSHLKDSLGVQDSFTSRTLKMNYDSVTLVGQNFPIETLTQLSQSTVRWIPYDQPDKLQTIHWKGIVRQGEMQRVTGRLQSSKPQRLQIRFGNQTLDSVALHEGNNSFILQFPAFARGNSQAELILNRTSTLDTVRFFTRATEPLMVQFLLNSPDFESKTLADWLGKQGHTVQLSATLSKQLSSNVRINQPAKSIGKTTPDLIITEPANANSPTIRKAIADGKAVLFINLTNAETDCRTINQAVGSQWQVRKTTNEPTVPVENGLTALPYRFADKLNQFAVSGYPIAIQRTTQRGLGGRVGASLLNETYPLSLSGDTIAYNRIWTAVLAKLSPSGTNTIEVDAPLYTGIREVIQINNPISRPRALRVGRDTLQLISSPLNERSAEGLSRFEQSGWQSVQDSLALYVDPIKSDDPSRNRQLISQFIRAHAQDRTLVQHSARQTTAQVPSWLWLLLLVACLAALWVEPKLV